MNPLKKGPEIKLSSLKPSSLKSMKAPDVKAPDFLVDLYWDLRDRHLLPLAILLVVALIAAPFVLGSSSSSESEDGAASGGGATATTSGAGATQTGALVAEAAPGLRDFHRRLEELEAKDPFKQQYAEKAESEGGEGSTSSGSAETYSTGSPSTSEGGGSSEPSSSGLTYFSFAIDVRISGGSENSESTVRHDLPELTMLPSRETPAMIFMGVTKDHKKALMLISSDVQAIFGDSKCVLGSQTCQMLALEIGLPETIVYGGAGKTYTIELRKIDLVESKKLNRAPLGDPKKGKGGNRPAFREAALP
jgi:hypothetical protein